MTRRHFRYASVQAWLKGEGLEGEGLKGEGPKGSSATFLDIADPRERDRRLAQYAQLRRHLFAKHLKTLLPDEPGQFAKSDHPSQSHRFADRARPFAAELREHLAGLGFRAEVQIGYYHMDRIVLSAMLPADPAGRRGELPWLFRGFEVLYDWPGTAANPG